MSISEEILTIANQIANEGNKPSIALVKKKLAKNVPLPTIISTLKVWQHDPSYTETKQTPDVTSPVLSTSEVPPHLLQAISEALAPIKEELREIKLALKALENKNSDT